MKYLGSIFEKRLIGFWLLLFTAATNSLFAQEPVKEDEIDRLLDELIFNEQQFVDDILDSFNTYNFIYTSISFDSNTYFTGRDSGVDQFNLVPQIAYYSSSGFNLSISGVFYEIYEPNWDFTSIYAGYYHTIGKKKLFNFNVGYSHYFYSDGWDAFTNSIDLGLGIRNKKQTLGTKLYGSYLFGTDQSFQITSRSFASATIVRQNNFVLKFRPQLNILIAQQTIALEQLNSQENEAITEYIYNDIFALLNTYVNLPFRLSTRSWDFELGYNINFPIRVETEPNLDPTGYFNASIGYLIDLDKRK